MLFDGQHQQTPLRKKGNDPVQSEEAVGTQGAMMDAGGAEGGMPGVPGAQPPGARQGRSGKELNLKIPEDGWPGSGRPKEGPKYGKDGSARGRDPLGAHDMKKGGSNSRKYGKPLALSHYDKLERSIAIKFINE